MSDDDELKMAQDAARRSAAMVETLVLGVQSIAEALGLDANATRADMLAEIARLREFERAKQGDA